MPSFLIIGATGNTGVGVVETLAKLLPSHNDFSSHRIIALTRDSNGSTAQRLAKIDKLEVIEKDWTYIETAWLREHDVERLFIASHNGVTHFTDETLLLTRALAAGVKHLVRISTTKGNVSPTTEVFYGRNHWAIENLLEQPEFRDMHWTSLQPNGFTSLIVPGPVNWVKTYKETGKKEKLALILDETAGVALVDPVEVGIIAGHILTATDTVHSHQKYVIVGPSNISGSDVVKAVEKYAGTTVDDVQYRDTSFVENLEGPIYPKYLLPSLALAPRSGYEGGSSIEQSPTSPEVMKLYSPKSSAAEALETGLSQIEK